jgi:hypothetical protein
MKRSLLLAFLFGSALCGLDRAFAYETPTHAVISQKAIGASTLDGQLSNIAPNAKLFSTDSLLSDGGFYFFGLTVFEIASSVTDWVAYGAISEDNFCCPPLRFLNHFYNPLAPAGQEGYANYGLTGLPSLQWGLEPTDISGQDYSFRDARNYYYQGLTASTERDRKRNLSSMFRAIGQDIHLVQDLAQPQHTRNDSHGSGSRYERYTNLRLSKLPFPGYAPVIVSTPDQFWVTPDGKGLANYTNRGFVTDGTNFTGTMSGNTLNIQANANFPSPNGIGATIVKKQITDADLLGAPSPTQTLLGEMWFVSTPVNDSYAPGASGINQRTSTFSIFDSDLAGYGASWTFAQNKFNFDAAHAFLIPRAVGYSAGLVNYFFRGQLAITAPAEVVYAMIDPNQSASFSKIKLKVQNITPNENMTGGNLWAVAKFHRNTCYQSDLSGEANGPNAPDIVACRSADEEVAMSGPQAVTLASMDTPTAMSFDFSAAPIPVNATDLFLQVVYRGPLGSETDAVAVGTKDVFEPTHLAFANSLDATEINSTFYLFDKIVAGIAASDPTFNAVDVNGDHSYTVPPDYNITPYDFNNVNISFTGNNLNPVAVIPTLPFGRFSRMTVLTDLPVLDFYPGPYHFRPPATTNQLSADSTTFFVTVVQQIRGAWTTDADIIIFCVNTTTCNNNDLTTVPASTVTDALTPEPVTVNIPFP